MQWRHQNLVPGGTNRGVETETPKGTNWVKNGRDIPPPQPPIGVKGSVVSTPSGVRGGARPTTKMILVLSIAS